MIGTFVMAASVVALFLGIIIVAWQFAGSNPDGAGFGMAMVGIALVGILFGGVVSCAETIQDVQELKRQQQLKKTGA